MAFLNHLTDGWFDSIDQTVQSHTYTFDTAGKIVDKNIKFQINVPGVVIPTPAAGEDPSTFYITIGGTTYNWTVDSDGNVWVD